MTIMASEIEASLRDATRGTPYHICRVSWNDARRTKDSCFGTNITDATLWTADEQTSVCVMRSENFNETVCIVPSEQISIMKPVHDTEVTPTTLRDYLESFGKYTKHVNGPDNIYMPTLDDAVTVRYQVVFVEPGEYVVHHYNYQARDDSPANAILLGTTQGTSVTKDASGKVKLYLQKLSHDGTKASEHTMVIDPTRFGVGGPQRETQAESEAAVAQGKATSAVIGTRALGTRLNTLVVMQVPLVQTLPPPKKYSEQEGEYMDDEDLEWSLDTSEMKTQYRGCKRSCKKSGKSSAGRVSIGTQVNQQAAPLPSSIKRHKIVPITATIMLYYVVEGGVPSRADIERAVSELDTLYAAGAGEKIFDGGHCTTDAPVFKGGVSVANASSFPR